MLSMVLERSQIWLLCKSFVWNFNICNFDLECLFAIEYILINLIAMTAAEVMTRAQFLYPIRRLIASSREISKPKNVCSELPDRSEI